MTETQTENISLVLLKPHEDVAIQDFYSQALRLKEYADTRIIMTNADLTPATEDLGIIAKVKKAMEERRKEYLKPFQEHVKETNEAYKNFMEPIEQADLITRRKITDFRMEQERKRAEAEAIEQEKMELARREAALNGGEITIDLTPIEKPAAVPDTVRTDMGNASTMKVRKWELVDIAQVPKDLLLVDAGKVTKLVKAGIGSIAGIRIWEEETLRVSTR